MRLLLDTHALLWTLDDNPQLSDAARKAVGDPANELLISSVSVFEITNKHRIGKLSEFETIARDFPAVLDDFEHRVLPVSIGHAALAGSLDIPIRDPFDRLLIAQSLIENVPLVSNERMFDGFGVDRLW